MRSFFALLFLSLAAAATGSDSPATAVMDVTWFGNPGPRISATTDLRVEKSGDDAVLSWTCSQPSGVTFEIYRGLLQAPFLGGLKVASTANLTWTDTGALARTVLGQAIDEYYLVWAIPSGQINCNPYNADGLLTEYAQPPRNRSQLLSYTLTNGEQFLSTTLANEGESLDITLVGSSRTAAGACLFDAWNFLAGGGMEGKVAYAKTNLELYDMTVDHAGYFAGAKQAGGTGDISMVTSTVRAMAAPAVSYNCGGQASLSWAEPVQDSAGLVESVRVYLDQLGLGSTATSSALATVPVAQSSVTVALPAAVGNGEYFFLSYCLVYSDGTESPHSASSAARMKSPEGCE